MSYKNEEKEESLGGRKKDFVGRLLREVQSIRALMERIKGTLIKGTHGQSS